MIFKNINSEDISGLIICSEPPISSSAIRTKETTIDGRDGAIVEKLGYKTRIRNVEIGLKKDANVDKILSYFSGEGDLIFKNENDKVYKAAIYEQVDLERLLRLRKGSVAFYCQPFKYKRNDIFETIKDNKVKEKKGKHLELLNCAEQNVVDLKLEGSTTQATRSGKNLLDNTATTKISNGITFTVNSDKTVLADGTNDTSANSSLIINRYDLSPGTYVLNGCPSGGAINTYRLAIQETGSYSVLGSIDIGNGSGEFTIDTTTIVQIAIFIQKGLTINKLLFKPMLRKATIADDTYEQYGASPSPDYPAKIENVEGKNKLNISTIVKGRLDSGVIDYETNVTKLILNKNSFTFTVNSTYKGVSSDFIPVIPNKIYVYSQNESLTDSFYIGVACYDKNKNWLKNLSIVSITIPANCYYIKIQWASLTIGTQTVTNPQLEEGTVATPYVPYNSLEIKDVGENLFDKKTNTILTWLTAAEITEEGSVCSKNFIPTTKNKIYATNFAACVFYYDKKLNYLGNSMDLRTDSGNQYTTWINPDNNSIAFMKVEYRKTLNHNLDMTTQEIMLTESETVKVYKPHQEQKVDFPLSEGQKLYEGSYLASDGIHHTRKQYTFTGNETFVKSVENNDYIRFYSPVFADVIKTSGYETIDKFMCTHFERIEGYNNSKNCIALSEKRFYIAISKNIVTDVRTFKTWLSQNHVTVEYELSEEEIVPYTTAQQEAYNQLQKLKLYKGQNTMFSMEGSIINLKYLEDTDEKVENQGNIYSKPIIRLEKTVFKEVEIAINGIRFKYNFEEDDYVEIDCEEMTVQYEGLDRNRRLVIDFEFPKLKEGNNDIIMYNGDCIIKCKRKDRWL